LRPEHLKRSAGTGRRTNKLLDDIKITLLIKDNGDKITIIAEVKTNTAATVGAYLAYFRLSPVLVRYSL